MDSNRKQLRSLLYGAQKAAKAAKDHGQNLLYMYVDEWVNDCRKISEHCSPQEFSALMLQEPNRFSHYDVSSVFDLLGLWEAGQVPGFLKYRLEQRLKQFPYEVRIYSYEVPGTDNEAYVIASPDHQPS